MGGTHKPIKIDILKYDHDIFDMLSCGEMGGTHKPDTINISNTCCYYMFLVNMAYSLEH